MRGRTPHPSDFTAEKAEACRDLVYAMAKLHNIPPVWITAKIRYPAADAARLAVMRMMIIGLKMKRWQVAACFSRDVRSVRKSVLGI